MNVLAINSENSSLLESQTHQPKKKDKEYWKEYNRKRKEKGYFQKNYLTKKGQNQVVKINPVVKSELVVKKVEPELVVKVVKKTIPETVVKSLGKILQPTNILQPDGINTIKAESCKVVKSSQETIILQPEERIKQLEEKLAQRQKLEVNNTGLSVNNAKVNNLKLELDANKGTDCVNRVKLVNSEKEISQVNSSGKELNNREPKTELVSPEKIIREDERFITFQTRFWDKQHQKFIYHSCADSCWRGKYCNNCFYTNQVN